MEWNSKSLVQQLRMNCHTVFNDFHSDSNESWNNCLSACGRFLLDLDIITGRTAKNLPHMENIESFSLRCREELEYLGQLTLFLGSIETTLIMKYMFRIWRDMRNSLGNRYQQSRSWQPAIREVNVLWTLPNFWMSKFLKGSRKANITQEGSSPLISTSNQSWLLFND